MLASEYLIVQLDDRWWVEVCGANLGPYDTFVDAEMVALPMAQHNYRAGLRARVTIAADKLHVIFDTTKMPRP